jgi:hypothetical protein
MGDGWTRAVRVHVAAVRTGEFGRALLRASTVEPLNVTQLLDLRCAYWGRIAPAPPSPERSGRMREGRAWHERIGLRVAPAARREVRLRRGDVRGKADLLGDRITEIKTTATVPDPSVILEERPQYFEQLGLYCALAGRTDARLVVVGTGRAGDGATKPVSVAAYDCRFENLEAVWAEAERRAHALRYAWALGTPRDLPRCSWRDRECEFRVRDVCSCTGAEPPAQYPIRDAARELTLNPGVADAFRRSISDAAPDGAPEPVIRRFGDLVYPRRTYFERTLADLSEEWAEEDGPVSESEARWKLERWRFRLRLQDAMETADPGSWSVEGVPTGEPSEPVDCHEGVPYLLKITRASPVTDPMELLHRSPQYFLELAFRCAALGSRVGRLVLGYPMRPRPEDRVRVYEAEFDPLDSFRQMALERREAIVRALATRDPSSLTVCPEWMFAYCPYRASCGG